MPSRLDYIKKTIQSQLQHIGMSDWRDTRVYITPCGNVCDVTMLSTGWVQGSPIVKVDSGHYMVLKSGEVKEYVPDLTGRNKDSLRRIFARLRQLINANFSGGDHELFCTLTYAENMQDMEQLYNEFGAFWKRLERWAEAEGGHKLSYISVVEPQGRGAWHIHLMLKSDKPLMIPNATMRRLWGHGHVKVERLQVADNLGAYYVTYFTDSLTPGEGDKSKRRIKGDRLKFYDDYDHIYRCSRDIVRPESFTATLGNVIDHYGEPTYATETVLPQSEEDIAAGKDPIIVARMQFKSKK